MTISYSGYLVFWLSVAGSIADLLVLWHPIFQAMTLAYLLSGSNSVRYSRTTGHPGSKHVDFTRLPRLRIGFP